MNVCSNSALTSVPTFLTIGSSARCSGEPPRLSSQLADQEIFMGSPLMSEYGRATGVCCCSGAETSVS